MCQPASDNEQEPEIKGSLVLTHNVCATNCDLPSEKFPHIPCCWHVQVYGACKPYAITGSLPCIKVGVAGWE